MQRRHWLHLTAWLTLVVITLTLWWCASNSELRRKKPSRVFFARTRTAPWNLLELHDERGTKLDNFIGVRADFWQDLDAAGFERALHQNADLRIVLVSSYQEFPGLVHNPFEGTRRRSVEKAFVRRYQDRIVLWCHCFRDADSVWRTPVPKLLLSESDLLPYEQPRGTKNTELQYDFVASVGKGPWNAYIRNLDVVCRIFRVAAEKLQLRCVLVGDSERNHLFPAPLLHSTGRVTLLPFLPRREFLALLQRTRFLLCASGPDASPRILVEAGRTGLALLVNSDIIGGWKYVQRGLTGTFFDCTVAEDDDRLVRVLADFCTHFRDRREAIQEYFARTTDPHQHAELLARTLQQAIGRSHGS